MSRGLCSWSLIKFGWQRESGFARGVFSLLLAAFALSRACAAETNSVSSTATNTITSTEHIFICCIYGPEPKSKVAVSDMLRRIGAQPVGLTWYYTNAVQGKVHVIHIVTSADEMKRALYTDDTHIMIYGHSNYGMGGVFATTAEEFKQTISTLRWVDDDRFLTYSSPWVAINVPKLLQRQSYPNWWPVYKDGTSAIMPYDFSDPHGDPPYNYFLTYQVPGDATRYKIEPVPNSGIQRFPDSGHAAWFAADGSGPNAKNPEHRKYFLINTNDSFVCTGKWFLHVEPTGFYGSNYLSIPAGAGSNQVKWKFSIPAPGAYTISAQWPTIRQNVTNALYSVNHEGGSTMVKINQRASGSCWSKLGEFTFNAGEYSVTLSDEAAIGSGDVVADAIKITGPTNSPAFERIVDNIACPKPHFGKKTIVAVRTPSIDPTKLRYKRMFYEGCLSGVYYLDVFHRGVGFYTLADSYLSVSETYLREYLLGRNDEQIWAAVQKLQPVFDYYDFSLPPSQQGKAQTENHEPAPALSQMDEAKIQRLAQSSPDRVFDALRRMEMIQNERLSRATAKGAFENRKDEGIRLAIQQMKVPLIEKSDLGRQSRIRALIAARRIMETFPDESVPQLLELYAQSEAIPRGNIIRVSGAIPGGEPIRKLLVDALDDKAVCEGPDWNSGGEPMRLCDEAYNQLVARYRIKGVMHTLAPPLSMDIREYHIKELKKRLPDIKE